MTDFMLGINLAGSLLEYETQPGSLLGMSSQWFETSILVLFLLGGNIKLKCVESVDFEVHCKIQSGWWS